MKVASKIILAAVSVSSVGMLGTAASAGRGWAANHPRQHEVLARDHHQIARIDREQRDGQITGAQARADRSVDRSIAAQDHADARANGGFITRGQQAQLNGEENAENRTIGR